MAEGNKRIEAEEHRSHSFARLLRDKILSGEITPGSRMLSERELVRKFDLTAGIVKNSLAILEKEGLIDRRHGSGTFVSAPAKAAAKDCGLLGLLTTFSEESIEDYFPTLANIAGEQHLLMVPLDIDGCRNPGWLESLNALLRRSPSGILIDSDETCVTGRKIPALAGKIPLCYVHIWNSAEPPPGPAVLFNLMAAYQMAFSYLLGKGHRRIVYLGHRQQPAPEERRRLDHLKRVLPISEEDIPYACFEDFEKNPDRVRKVFGPSKRPTALVARGDYFAFTFREKLRAKFPAVKVEMVGMHNTKWSRQPGKEFHTIQVDYETMWRRALHAVAQGEAQRRQVEWISPVFVER